jgi:hypothetical protein
MVLKFDDYRDASQKDSSLIEELVGESSWILTNPSTHSRYARLRGSGSSARNGRKPVNLFHTADRIHHQSAGVHDSPCCLPLPNDETDFRILVERIDILRLSQQRAFST